MDQAHSPRASARAAEARRRGVRAAGNGIRRCTPGRRARWRRGLQLAIVGLLWNPSAAIAQLLDRVVARVGGNAITLTDVQAAVALGVVDVGSAVGEEAERAAVARTVERRLLLVEVGRFPPADPADAAVASLVTTMKERAGTRYEGLLRSTGLDEQRVRELARDTLRIEAYLNQRFGASVQVSEEEVRAYYASHQQAFTRGGVLAPFEQVTAAAREGASDERRRRTVAQWLQDLRARGDVIEVTPRSPRP